MEKTQFRARRWPVPLGSDTDLKCKSESLRDGHPQPEIDLPFEFEDLLDSFEKYVDLREWSQSKLPTCQRGELSRTFSLFAQETWRLQVWRGCVLDLDEDDLCNAQADTAFMDLKGRMCNATPRHCYAVREMVVWLMKHDLDALKFLLQQGQLHVGNHLFPQYKKTGSMSLGEAESLLGIAIRDAHSPAAVVMLLEYGADPNGEFAPRTENPHNLPTCGTGALASLSVQGIIEGANSNAPPTYPVILKDKLAIYTALANAGAKMCDSFTELKWRNEMPTTTKEEKAEFELCSKLFDVEIQREKAYARQRFETVVALVGIISFWRRCAALPDSKAAIAAIKRVIKRTREEE